MDPVCLSLTLSFSHSLIPSFSHSLILSFPHSPILFIPSFSFPHSPILSFSHSLIPSFPHSFIPFIPSFSHSLICSFFKSSSQHQYFAQDESKSVNLGYALLNLADFLANNEPAAASHELLLQSRAKNVKNKPMILKVFPSLSLSSFLQSFFLSSLV